MRSEFMEDFQVFSLTSFNFWMQSTRSISYTVYHILYIVVLSLVHVFISIYQLPGKITKSLVQFQVKPGNRDLIQDNYFCFGHLVFNSFSSFRWLTRALTAHLVHGFGHDSQLTMIPRGSEGATKFYSVRSSREPRVI